MALTSTAILLMSSLGGNEYPWKSTPILGLIFASVICLCIYIFVERKAEVPITPLHLFKSSIFVISSLQFMLTTLVLFVGMIFVPMFLQLIFQYTAFKAGLFIIPKLVGLIATTGISGYFIANTKRYKIYPVIGAILTGLGMLLLGLVSKNTGTLFIVASMIIAGAGEGFLVQVCLLAGQNAVDYKYLGVATGTLNFFKSLGGAYGTAIFGAILNSGLSQAVSMDSQVTAFHKIFFLCVPIMGLSVVLGLIMEEKPLSEKIQEIVEGKAEAPDY